MAFNLRRLIFGDSSKDKCKWTAHDGVREMAFSELRAGTAIASVCLFGLSFITRYVDTVLYPARFLSSSLSAWRHLGPFKCILAS